MVSGGVVEQGHASRLCLARGAGRIRACLADCWSESFGCGGLTLASELGQSQLPDVLQKPASRELFDYSNAPQTVSNAKRACYGSVSNSRWMWQRGTSEQGLQFRRVPSIC